MTRVPSIDPSSLNADERSIYDAIAGPRGGVGGPFAAWFAVPQIAGRVNALVDRLRFASALDRRIFELITLVVARDWSAPFIWRAHANLAAKAGIPEPVIAAIESGVPPPFEAADERTAFELVHHLLEERSVPDDLFARARDFFGDAGIVEIVTVAGYYAMNAMISKTFDIN